MIKVCPYRWKGSSDLNFRGAFEAFQSACLIIDILWYFQKFGDNDILTIFWKWYNNCIKIYHQTIFWGLLVLQQQRHHCDGHCWCERWSFVTAFATCFNAMSFVMMEMIMMDGAGNVQIMIKMPFDKESSLNVLWRKSCVSLKSNMGLPMIDIWLIVCF